LNNTYGFLEVYLYL